MVVWRRVLGTGKVSHSCKNGNFNERKEKWWHLFLPTCSSTKWYRRGTIKDRVAISTYLSMICWYSAKSKRATDTDLRWHGRYEGSCHNAWPWMAWSAHKVTSAYRYCSCETLIFQSRETDHCPLAELGLFDICHIIQSADLLHDMTDNFSTRDSELRSKRTVKRMQTMKRITSKH